MPLTAFKNGRADIAGCIKRKEFEHNLIGYIPMDKPEKQNRHDENRACFKKCDFIAFQQHCLRGVFPFSVVRLTGHDRVPDAADTTPALLAQAGDGQKLRRLKSRAAGVFYTVFVQPFWISSSAICTQLVAAPLRT